MKRKILAILLAVVLACAAGVGIYAADFYRADETAQQAMVTAWAQDGLLIFGPETADTGFVFYPGGKVEASAYAPLMQRLAEADVLCVICKMPLNLAVLDSNAAQQAMRRFPQVENWYVGGHSLGGAMAASYAAQHADDLQGVALLAAYSTADLSGSGLQVISLYGSEDGVLNRQKYAEYANNLPADAAEIVIEGGNHALFGSYGAQQGDGESTITGAEQQAETADALLAFFGKMAQ